MDFMELSSQVVLQGYGQFLESYTRRLRASERRMDVPWISTTGPVHVKILNEDHCGDLYESKKDDKEELCITHLFLSLIKRIKSLKEELTCDLLPRLKRVGETEVQRAVVEGHHVMVDQVLPLYFDVLSFVRRSRELLVHVLEQLVRLYSHKCAEGRQSDGEVDFISLYTVYESVGDLLLLFVGIDASIASYHRDVEPRWNSLKQSVLAASNDTGDFLTAVAEVQGELLTGLVFDTAVNFVLNEKSRVDPNCLLEFRFNRFLDNQCQELEFVDRHSSRAMDDCARALAVFCFAHRVYSIKDKKIKKFVVGFSKKFPGMALYNQVFWSPCDFLTRNSRQFALDSNIEAFDVCFPPYVELFGSSIKARLKEFASKILIWCLKIEECCSTEPGPVKLNDMEIINLCLEGLQLCDDIKYLVICGSRFYFYLNRPISKSLALTFCKLLELLGGVHSVFRRHALTIGKTSHHAVQKVSIKILSKIINSKKMLYGELKRPLYKKLYSTLCRAEKIFYQACTEDRIILVNLLPSSPSNLVDVEYNYTLIKCYCTQLDTIVNLNKFLKETSVNLFGVAESDILPLHLRSIMESETSLARVKYIMSKEAWESGEESPMVSLRKEIVQPLCQQVETKLRLDALAHLNPDNLLPAKSKDLRKFLRTSPIIYDNSFYLLKTEVEKYLERTWHDLLTVSLHDWRGYREMRSLAYHRYGLKTVEDTLPCQAPAPGLDVLQLMRNIGTFVSEYRYNLNDETFIEISSNNKHLNTVSVELVAGSIQTHGSGILNTTTNFIYQFLRNRLMTFCQYLFDENFKCRLIKDHNYLKEDRKRVYSFERGEKMLKSGRRAAETTEGLRDLITQVGNTLGFVRLIAAGARQHSMSILPFLPNALPEMPDGCEITANLGRVLEDSLRDACTAPCHLSLLVNVFSQAFNKLDAVHAPLFALAVPPLTLSHVRHTIAVKERLAKRQRAGASFADDGFTLGLAYLLSVLNLNSSFDSLAWFDTVDGKYQSDETSLLSRAGPQDNNTTHLSLNRLNMFRQEFQLLRYNLISARTILSSN